VENKFVVTGRMYEFGEGRTLQVPVGSQLLSFDGKTISVFVAEGGRLYLTEAKPYSRNVFFREFYTFPYPENTEMLLLSSSVTFLGVQKPQSNIVEQVDIHDISPNKTHNLILTVQLVIALLFWFSGLILYLFRPDRLLTLCFNLHFGFSSNYLVANLTLNRYTDDFLFVVVMLCSGLIPLGLIYLVLAFPYGKTLSHKTSLVFWLICLPVVLVVGLLTYFYFTNSRLYTPIVQFVAPFRLYFLVGLCLVGYILLFVRFYRAKGEERLKIRLVCMTFLSSWVTPLLLFLMSVFFNLFPEFIYNYFTLFCIPTVFFPIVLIYSIIKHRLYYPDLVVRNILAYALFTIFLLVLYFFTTVFISFLIKVVFGVENEGLGILAFGLIAVLAARLQSLSQKLIERIFYRDKPNYTDLIKKWTGILTFSDCSLSHICAIVAKSIPTDFRYSKVAILLLENAKTNPYKAEFIFENVQEHSNFVTPVIKAYFLEKNGHNGTCLLSEHDGIVRQIIDFDYLAQTGLSLKEINVVSGFTLPTNFAEIKSAEPLLGGLNYQYIVPFSPKGILQGGLLLAGKLSEQVPSKEEQSTLEMVANQVALAIDNAVKVEFGQVKNQLIQSFVIKRDAIADNERQNIAEEVHDTAVHDIVILKQKLYHSINNPQKRNKLLDPQRLDEFLRDCFEMSNLAETHLREVINGLYPHIMNHGLLIALRELLDNFVRKNPEIEFTFQFTSYCDDYKDQLKELEKEKSQKIYRIVHESLNNAVKHSHATKVAVQVEISQAKKITLEIKDNGVGFATCDLYALKGHYGLLFMQERAKELGGAIFLRNRESGGAVVQAFIPLPSFTATKELENSDAKIRV
jgi:signal transduction histidine kinase